MADAWDLPEPKVSPSSTSQGQTGVDWADVKKTMKSAGADRPTAFHELMDLGRASGEMVPKTPQDALFLGGTLVAPYAKILPYLGKIPMPVIRTILGAAGAEVGSQLEGKPTGVGAVQGLVGGATGEVLGGSHTLGSWALSKTPWGRANAKAIAEATVTAAKAEANQLAATRSTAETMVGGTAESMAASQQQQRGVQMTQGVGGVMGQASPPMRTGTAAGMENIARTPGETRKSLGKYFDSKLSETEGIIGADTKIRVPSLVDEEAIRQKVKDSLGKQGAPQKVIDEIVNQEITAQSRMTVRDAADKLAQLGLRGFSETGERRGAFIPREQRRQALEEIRAELGSLDPAAARSFEEGRRGFSVGLSLLATLKKEGIFDKTPEGTSLNIRELQGAISRNRERLQRSMEPGDWNALRNIVFEGGDLAKMDLPTKSLVKQAGESAVSRFNMGAGRTPAFDELLANRQPTSAPFSGSEMLQIVIDSAIERGLNRKPAR